MPSPHPVNKAHTPLHCHAALQFECETSRINTLLFPIDSPPDLRRILHLADQIQQCGMPRTTPRCSAAEGMLSLVQSGPRLVLERSQSAHMLCCNEDLLPFSGSEHFSESEQEVQKRLVFKQPSKQSWTVADSPIDCHLRSLCRSGICRTDAGMAAHSQEMWGLQLSQQVSREPRAQTIGFAL